MDHEEYSDTSLIPEMSPVDAVYDMIQKLSVEELYQLNTRLAENTEADI